MFQGLCLIVFRRIFLLSVFLGIGLRKTQMILDKSSLDLSPNIVKIIQMYGRAKVELEK